MVQSGYINGRKIYPVSNPSLEDIVTELQRCNDNNILLARKAEILFTALMGKLQPKQWTNILGDAFAQNTMDNAIAQALSSPPQMQSYFLEIFAPELIAFILKHRSESVIHRILASLHNKTWAILFPYIPSGSQRELCDISQNVGINNISLYCKDVTKVPEELQTSEVSQAYIDIYKWLRKVL